jgi:hypothetical protein
MPQLPGSVTLSAAETATAASAALPPAFKISIPAEQARGCVEAIKPFLLYTTLLLEVNGNSVGGIVFRKTAMTDFDPAAESLNLSRGEQRYSITTSVVYSKSTGKHLSKRLSRRFAAVLVDAEEVTTSTPTAL